MLEEQPNSPNIPDDASEIFESLSDRDKARRHAIEVARRRADEAQTPEDRAYFVNLAAVMSDVRFELHELFPEVFRDDD